MTKQMRSIEAIDKTQNGLLLIGVEVLITIAFLSLKFLLEGNMGDTNEVDILPFARQHTDPTWIPGDWYLNQPAGYRLPFIFLFGRLTVIWGFLATSIVGRLLCYGLLSLGLVLLGRTLRLSFPLFLLAIALFLYLTPEQGAIAREWLVGGIEPKSVAYGWLLLAVVLMLKGRYRLMALMLGLTTSFHVLIGVWAALAVGVWLFIRRNRDFANVRYLGSVLLVYLASSAFAIWTVLEQLFALTTAGTIKPSFLYVFLRSPHHLNPLSWTLDRWLKPSICLLLLGLSVALLYRQRQSEKSSEARATAIGLAEFTLITLIPFILGLLVAPFDSQGSLLQYYPFRVGDILLPLDTSLLLSSAIESNSTGKVRQGFFIACIVLLSSICSVQSVKFGQQLVALQQFPSQQQEANPEWKALCNWIRTRTPKNAIFISSPAEFNNFTWMAERPTIAKFKLMPPTSASVLEWYERLIDLSGNIDSWSSAIDKKMKRKEIESKLTAGYNRLDTTQAQQLMKKYRAAYFVTGIQHHLSLPIAYQNSDYIIYSQDRAES